MLIHPPLILSMVPLLPPSLLIPLPLLLLLLLPDKDRFAQVQRVLYVLSTPEAPDSHPSHSLVVLESVRRRRSTAITTSY